MRTDEEDYRFLSRPDAKVMVRLVERGDVRLLIEGNRSGLLALSNIFLWLVSVSGPREFLSMAELPYVRLEGELHFIVRLTWDEVTGRDGALLYSGSPDQWEWAISEDDLIRVAFTIHSIVTEPGENISEPVLATRAHMVLKSE